MPLENKLKEETVIYLAPINHVFERFNTQSSLELLSLPVIDSVNMINDAVKVLERTMEYNQEEADVDILV